MARICKMVIRTFFFFLRCSFHSIEVGYIKFQKSVGNSIGLTNNICHSCNTGKKCSYSDACKAWKRDL